MRRAVMMTNYRRPRAVLENTLASLRRALPREPLFVVDDGSGESYRASVAEIYRRHRATEIATDTLAAHPDTYHLDGYNNPAHALNVGLDAVEAAGIPAVVVAASDCMVQPRVSEWLDAMKPELTVSVPATIDLDSGECYCSTQRLRPFPWWLYTTTRAARDCGAWDLAYLRGMAFEDNDFAARIACHVGHVWFDDRVTVWHQSHAQTAYSDRKRGWNTNEAYTRTKWGGTVPWNEAGALDVRLESTGPRFALVSVRRGGAEPEPERPSTAEQIRGWLHARLVGCASVLELGAGNGSWLAELPKPITRRTGIEIFPDYIAAGAKRYPWVSLRAGDMRRFEALIGDEQYDAAVFLDSLEHLPKADALDLLARCQQRFARVLVFCPEGDDPQQHDATGCDNPYQQHLSTWTAEDFHARGFEVVVARDFHAPKPHEGLGARSALFCAWVRP